MTAQRENASLDDVEIQPPLSDDEEEFLADLLDRVLDDLAEGREIAVDALAATRPSLQARIRALVAAARASANCRPPPRPRFAGYELVRELGRGGMGSVHLARQSSLARLVALKVLPRTAALSERGRARFLQEARALARVRHEHVVAIFDVIEQEDALAYAMEWVDGETLETALARRRGVVADGGKEGAGAIDVPWIASIGRAIARALAAAHAAGVLHRDVKPANVLLRRDGTPLLTDFGLAREPGTAGMTTAGEFLGTLGYASPEQLRGEADLDERTDVFALGATLYRAISGRVPFEGRSATAVLAAIERGGAPPLRRVARRMTRHVPRDLETIVDHALEPERERRYANAAEFADDLDRLLTLQPIRARPPTLATRAVRFGRRHRTLLATAACAALLATLFGLFRLQRVRAELEAPARAAAHVAEARLALLDPGFRVRAYFELGRAGADFVDRSARSRLEPPALQRALAEYDAAFRLRPPDGVLAAERAVVARVAAGELPASAAELAQQIAAEPGARRQLGLLAALIGWPQLVREAWDDFDLSPRADPLVDGLMGELLLELDQPAAAWPRLVRAFDEWPSAGMLATSIADAAIRCGDVEAAQRWLARARALPHTTLPAIRFRIHAELLRAAGRPKAALALLEWMERTAGTTPRGHALLIDLLREQGRFDDALAVALRPGIIGASAAAALLERLLVDDWVARSGAGRARAAFAVLVGPSTPGDLLYAEALRAASRGTTLFPAVASQGVRPGVRQDALRDLRLLAEATTMIHDLKQRFRSTISAILRRSRRTGAWPLALAAGLFFAGDGEAAAQNVVWSRQGASSSDLYANTVAAIGDCDADGIADLLVGTPFSASGASQGSIDLLSGATGSVIFHHDGEFGGDLFGINAADAGDTDGDGVHDIIVGARSHNVGGLTLGTAYVYSGADGSLLRSFDGEGNGDLFGHDVAGLGDVDGDGKSDVVVGAPHRQVNGISLAGKLYVYSGASGAFLYSLDGEAFDDELGILVTGGFEIDGDGRGDFAAAALFDGPNGVDAGRVYVYSGATGALLHAFDGDAAGDLFGIGIGEQQHDVDGDGTVDLLIGAFQHDGPAGGDSGRAYLYSGRTFQLLGTMEGRQPGALLGVRSTMLGDQDGDGVPELVCGASLADQPRHPDGGQALVFSGRTLRLYSVIKGRETGEQLGGVVADLGDVNGDGIADLAVGARACDGAAGVDCGRVIVFAGNDLFLEADPEDPAATQNLDLTTRGGVAGSPTALAVVEFGGVPTFLVIDLTLLDANGEHVFSAIVPPGLSGLDAVLQSFALTTNVRVADSNEVLVEFQ